MRSDLVAAWVRRLVEGGRTPGGAWWVESGETVVSRGLFGNAEVEPERRPLLETTPWDLASLTKPFATAVLLVQAHRSGEIDLESPAKTWLTELRDTVAGRARLMDLARHRGGLPAWRPLYVGEGGMTNYLSRIGAEPVAGEGELYSDLGYIVLGAVLERATGQPLPALFAERIAIPLGLLRTGFSAPDRFPDAAATETVSRFEAGLAGEKHGTPPFDRVIAAGHTHDGNADGLGGAAGHAGLFGPLDEIARLVRSILRPSALELGDAGRQWLFRPGPGGRRTVGFVTAAGSRAARGILPSDSPGHEGFTGTSVWLDPPADRFYLLLTNRVHPRVTGDFQPVRRAFHRVAAAVAGGFYNDPGAQG